MVLCPVDLARCARTECQAGRCGRVDAATLSLCWECGAIEAQGIVADMCIACVASTIAAEHPPKE